MAPMDKYTRLVEGAEHGPVVLSQEMLAKANVFFSPHIPFIKPGNKGSGVILPCLSDVVEKQTCNVSFLSR